MLGRDAVDSRGEERSLGMRGPLRIRPLANQESHAAQRDQERRLLAQAEEAYRALLSLPAS